MKIASLTEDRKKLIKALEKATGLKAKYLGAPSFNYEIGPYTVDRTGELIVSDEEVDKEILQELITKELVFNPESAEQEATIISLPITDHDGRSLKNLVNMIHSRSVLLSKAVGRLGQFKVSEELVTSLDGQTPQTVEDFLQILEAAGEGALQGLSFESGKIGFIFLIIICAVYVENMLSVTKRLTCCKIHTFYRINCFSFSEEIIFSNEDNISVGQSVKFLLLFEIVNVHST